MTCGNLSNSFRISFVDHCYAGDFANTVFKRIDDYKLSSSFPINMMLLTKLLCTVKICNEIRFLDPPSPLKTKALGLRRTEFEKQCFLEKMYSILWFSPRGQSEGSHVLFLNISHEYYYLTTHIEQRSDSHYTNSP